MSFINVENISFRYGDETILSGINMEVNQGDFVCILGQSGCGKSTFLRLMAGLDFPCSGNISVDDRIVDSASLERGVVFQDYSLFPWFTAGKNIMLPLQKRFKGKTKSELKQRALSFLNKVGLSEAVFNKYPNELSGGMRQRCAICRAFALNPPILLMDEPFGALDAVTRARLQDLVLSLWQQDETSRKTILFVTHDVDEALYLSTQIYVLGQSPSKVIFTKKLKRNKSLTREQLLSDPETGRLRQSLVQILNRDIETKLQ